VECSFLKKEPKNFCAWRIAHNAVAGNGRLAPSAALALLAKLWQNRGGRVSVPRKQAKSDTSRGKPTAAEIAQCDREPIQFPGAILPHGAMLVMDPQTLEILQLAGDVSPLLGAAPKKLLGQTAAAILQPHQTAMLRQLAASADLRKPRHLLDPLLRVIATQPLDASLHRSGDTLVLEFEAADLQDRFASDPLSGVQEMVQGLDAAGSLHAMCQHAADRVRDVAGYDRVLVYRFMQDESGWVVAESRQPHLAPFLGMHYPAADIPRQARALYVHNWLRLITQVNYDPAPLIPALNPRTGATLDMSQAILRDVSPVHREYLRNMGIDASMSISIVRGGKLWGLIACHHNSPRILPRHLRAVCELFGSMFSLELEAREKAERFNERLASRMVLQALMLNLASADNYAVGLTQQSPNLLDYIVCGEKQADGTRQGGVAVAVDGHLTSLGNTPGSSDIAALVAWLDSGATREAGLFATDRLGEIWPPAQAFAGMASGVLVISVSDQPSDYIIWFRPELVGTTTWAGEPGKVLEEGPDGPRLAPRKSFEQWKETVRGRSLPWTEADIDAAFDLRVSLLQVVLRRISEAAAERRHAAERDKLLMAELDHRVKNTIANIQALVMQTSQSADTLTSFVKGLDGRIQSMAKAHNLLSEGRWEGVWIDKLLHEELDPYAGANTGIGLHGAPVLLTSKAALAVSLAVHELVTNAAKYGALSRPGGRITVDWRRQDSGGIQLSWRESGGPLVTAPTRRGFGSTLIERALAMETGGHASVHYLRGGVVCEVFLPAAAVAAAPAAASLPPAATPAPAAMNLAPTRPAVTGALRVFVVEDSALVLLGLEMVFKHLGWVMVGPATRRGAAMALAASNSEQFDVALLDINLDGEMSWEVAAALRARGIPIVFTTGYDVHRVLPPAFRDIQALSKPFSMEDMEQALRRAIANRK
jgi:light-regulated signal transduction histidine kinase (bacteriophytochrome)